MVGMSRARIEEKKEQRKESEDLMTEVEVWRKARERRKIHGQGVNVGIIIYVGACLINA